MRKQKQITVIATGRDKDKTYLLTEMPASQGERWAIKVFMALAKSGVELPADPNQMGMAEIAALSFAALAGVDYEYAGPLLDEMMECVKFIPDTSRPEVVRKLVEDDIEEIPTRLMLRREIFALHTDFFTQESPST